MNLKVVKLIYIYINSLYIFYKWICFLIKINFLNVRDLIFMKVCMKV